MQWEHYLIEAIGLSSYCTPAILKAHYATIFAKITLIMQVESRSDRSTTISASFGGCFIAPSRFSKEKANMQLALFGPTQSGCDAAEVSKRASKM